MSQVQKYETLEREDAKFYDEDKEIKVFGIPYTKWLSVSVLASLAFFVTILVVYTTITATGHFHAKFNICASSITSNETLSKGNIEADWNPNQKCHAYNYGYVIGSSAAMIVAAYIMVILVFILMKIYSPTRLTNGTWNVFDLSEYNFYNIFLAPGALLSVNISPMMAIAYFVYMPMAMVLTTVFITISTTETVILIGALAFATECIAVIIMFEGRADGDRKYAPGVTRSGVSFVSLFFFALLTAFQVAFLIYWISVYPSKTIRAEQIVVVIFMCLHLVSRACVRICYYLRTTWAIEFMLYGNSTRSGIVESVLDISSGDIEKYMPMYARYETLEQVIFYAHAIIVLTVFSVYAQGHDWIPERNFY